MRVGPLGGEGAIEPFDLAVGLRPVGAGPFVDDAGTECSSEFLGAIAGSVIGQDACDGDPMVGEEGPSAGPEPGRGVLAFICEDLGIGEPGVVVDSVVQVGVAHPGAGLSTGLTADLAVPTAVGDAAELFDVDMDQVAGTLVLVSVRVRSADGQAGGLVEVGEFGHLVAAQHGLDGRFRQVQVVGDAVRAPSAGESQCDDAAFGAGRGPVWAGPRA